MKAMIAMEAFSFIARRDSFGTGVDGGRANGLSFFLWIKILCGIKKLYDAVLLRSIFFVPVGQIYCKLNFLNHCPVG